MANYRSTILCKHGREILAKAFAGEVMIKFTSIKTSDTIFTEDQLPNLEGIGTIKQVGKLSQMEQAGQEGVILYTSFNNSELTEGYYVRNFGIYVEDPDNTENELLYSIVNADESKIPASHLPAFNGVGVSGIDFNTLVTVSSFDSVTCVIDPSAGVTASMFKEHTDSGINSEEGIHGLRYFNDELSYKTEEGWISIETGGGGIAPNNVGNLSIKVGNEKLTLFWDDPEDTVVEGQTLCTWAGTKLVVKAGSYPESVKDGMLLLDNKIRGAYSKSSSAGFEFSGTNGTTYYFKLFPYSDHNSVNLNEANNISGTPQPFVVFGVDINLADSNPNTWATYTDDAVGMEAGSAEWDNMPLFRDIASYLFKDGAEVGKLKKGDPTKFEDGTTADITSGNAGDVMTKFTRGGLKMWTTGNILSIRITDNPEAEGFSYKAFKRGSADRDCFYLGRYKGYVSGGKMRSLSGKTPTANQTIGTFRNNAHAMGSGYENSGYYQLLWRQALYAIKYKMQNAQDVIGKGYVGGSAVTTTGSTNGKGDTYGTSSTTQQMILFGLEDFYGNIWEWVDGLVTDASRNILTATDNFNDSGSGYDSFSSGVTSNIGNYLSKPQGNADTGFTAKEVNGSATTYFCDSSYLSASCVARFGGSYSSGDSAGVFYFDVYGASSFSDAGIGGRLMFL